MMKPTLKLSLMALVASFSIFPVFGQAAYPVKTNDDLHQNYILATLSQQASAFTAEKPTGTKQRVVAQTQTNSNLWDSTSFIYSGTKGSRYNYNSFTYNESLLIGWLPSQVMPNVQKPEDVLADTLIQIENSQITSRDYGIYRPDNQLSFVQSELGAWAFPNDRYQMAVTYDATNRPITYYFSSYSSATPADTTNILHFFYNASGKIEMDSSWIKDNGGWEFESTTQYHYSNGIRMVDSQFSMSSSVLSPKRVTTYAYYPDGKLETMKSVAYDQGSPIQIIHDSLGYISNVPYATFWENKSISPSTGNSSSRRIKIFYPNASTNLPDSARWIIYSTSSQSEKIYRYEYNSFQNPEKITVYNSTSPTSNPYNILRFYYETFDDGVSVKEIVKENDVQVYPNPFNKVISVSTKGPSILTNLSLINISGQKVFSKSLNWQQGSYSLNVPNLIPGVYTLLLQDARGNIYTKRVVNK